LVILKAALGLVSSIYCMLWQGERLLDQSLFKTGSNDLRVQTAERINGRKHESLM